MKIGLDFDGVIADCGALKCRTAKRMYGLDIPMERFKREHVVGAGLLTTEQYNRLQNDVYGNWEFARHAEPVHGAKEAIPLLRSLGHEVRVITSRTEGMLDNARAWAGLHGLDLHFTGVGVRKSKADAAAGLDVFVDDDLDKLEGLVGTVPHRFLFGWPYNAHVDPAGVAVRVTSWAEFLERVAEAHEARRRLTQAA